MCNNGRARARVATQRVASPVRIAVSKTRIENIVGVVRRLKKDKAMTLLFSHEITDDFQLFGHNNNNLVASTSKWFLHIIYLQGKTFDVVEYKHCSSNRVSLKVNEKS